MEKTQEKSGHESLYANYKKVLKGAVDGQVVTRFPPEPSGFLHVGHVKAAMLNYHYAKIYKGKMLLRFDDTNPMNEKVEFVDSIQRDLKTLDVHPDQISHTSDHFPKIIEYMKKAIADGLAYADCGTGEQMKEQRDNGIESEWRTKNKVEDNQRIFQEMLDGKTDTWDGKKWCIRGKMDMQNKKKCLRDPVWFRTKVDVPHHRHGTKYKAYPNYDFACPIVDSLEGVTHALRTSEYNDRNEGYHWLQDKLGLRKVELMDFSKLQFIHTELSKRKLRWFIEEGHCDSWEDPRFPTVQGIMRHGMTPLALTKFMLENGASRKTVLMEWDKIWAINKDVIDPVVPRYTAIRKETAVKLVLTNGPDGYTFETHPLVQKKPEIGSKTVQYGKNLLIERDDAAGLAVGEKVTLLKWGNVNITSKEEKDGTLSLTGELNLSDKDFKKTKKITWIAEDPNTNVEFTIWELGHIITKRVVEDTDDVSKLVNPNSKVTYSAIAEGNVRSLQKGQRIQLERRGYFIVDQQELVGKQMTLILIPDGKTKGMSVIKSEIDAGAIAKGTADGKKKKGGKEADATQGEDGEKKLSKKELNKLARKQKQQNAKEAAKGDGGKAGGAPQQAAPASSSSGKKEVKAAVEMTYGTIPQELTATLNFCEKALATNHYIHGDRLTSLDKDNFEKLKPHEALLSPLTHPYTFSWYGFVSHFADAVRASWPVAEAPKAEGKAGAKKDDGGKKKKKVVVAMSIVMLEVKPLDDTTDLDALAKRILANITQDGLFWKTEYKKEPVAFGIFKLICGFSLEDEKVSVDEVVERIEAFDDMVQSVEIASFNKI